MNRLTRYIALTALLLSALTAAAQSVVKTTCEFELSPLAVESAAPRFGWQLADRKADEPTRQLAYAIEVVDAAGNSVWQSGKVASDRSQLVRYAGSPLQPLMRYRWRVQVWFMRNACSPLAARISCNRLSGSELRSSRYQ